MTQTKICPACKKEIPVQAVRCKHCRIKISSPSKEVQKPTTAAAPPPPSAMSPGANQAKKTSLAPPPPPPPSRASVPPPMVTPGGLPKKKNTLPPPPMDGGTSKSQPEYAAPVSPPQPSDISKSAGDPKPRVRPSSLVSNKSSAFSGKPQAGALPASGLGSKTVLGMSPIKPEDLKPKTGPEPEIETESRDTSENIEDLVSEATAGMADVAGEDERTDSTEQMLAGLDNTQEITLDDISGLVEIPSHINEESSADQIDDDDEPVDDVGQVGSKIKPALDKAGAAVSGAASLAKQKMSVSPEKVQAIKEKVSRAPAALRRSFSKLDEGSRFSSFLGRKLVSEEILSTMEYKGRPEGIVGFLRRLYIFHALALALALVVVIVVVSLTGSDDDELPSENKTKVLKDETAEKDSAKEVASPEPVKKTVAAEPVKEEPIVETCKPISDYPKFPWHTHIQALVNSAGAKGICGLANISAADVEKAFEKMTHLGPTGYDLLPGGEVLKVFPSDKKDRLAPSMSFLFVNSKLYEIHFDYKGLFAKQLPADLFQNEFSESFEKIKDEEKNKHVRFVDGDTIAERTFNKDMYGRVFNEIIFANKALRESLGKKNGERLKAEARIEKGVSLLGQKKYKNAISAFRGARESISHFGISYTWEGITHLQKEEFKKAGELAQKALNVSTDDRAKAEANGLLAIAALYSGDKDKALELFQAAKKLDPTHSEFETSVKELDTGKYDPDRVAKTAARLHCLEESQTDGTQKGILARGNFASKAAYSKILKIVEKKAAFKKELSKWVGWVCPE